MEDSKFFRIFAAIFITGEQEGLFLAMLLRVGRAAMDFR